FYTLSLHDALPIFLSFEVSSTEMFVFRYAELFSTEVVTVSISDISETTSFEAKPLPAKATQANALNKKFLIFLLSLMMLPTEIFKSLWQLTPTAFLVFRKLKTVQ